jgi:hypothetical protein
MSVLRIGTWNLEKCGVGKSKFWAKRIAKEIHDSKVQLISFQEIGLKHSEFNPDDPNCVGLILQPIINELKKMGLKYGFANVGAVGMITFGVKEHLPVLFDLKVLKIARDEDLNLHIDSNFVIHPPGKYSYEADDGEEQEEVSNQARGQALYTFTFKSNGADEVIFSVINCHFQANSGGKLQADSSDQLFNEINVAYAVDDQWPWPVVLIGDFNQDPKVFSNSLSAAACAKIPSSTTRGGKIYDHIYFLHACVRYGRSAADIAIKEAELFSDTKVYPIPAVVGTPTYPFDSDMFSYISDHHMVATTLHFSDFFLDEFLSEESEDEGEPPVAEKKPKKKEQKVKKVIKK